MDPTRWTRVRAILERALELEGGAREQLVASECEGDVELLREIRSLIGAEPSAGAFEPPTPAELSRALEDRNIGRRVGPFIIESLLGAGGMGAVYLARRAEADFEQRVALKLTKRGMDTDDILAQFRRERALLAALRHTGIAQLHDGGATDDGLPWFAMEYVDGQPIDAWCGARKLSVRQRVQLFIEVCAAVQFAHQNLVVHRDLKPSNILVTRGGVPKLLDFGIAKLLGSDSASTAQRTLADQRRLTPDYASPEQLGGEPVTTASDVYSLGVILCELLTGANPFRGSTRRERDDPPRPSTLLAGAPGAERARVRQLSRELRGDLDTIVTTALAVDAARRYASVEALGAELRRWLEGLPIHARPATVAYLTNRFVRRNRIAVAAGTAVFVALVGGLIAARAGYVEAVSQRTLAQQRQAQAELESRRANSVLTLTRSMLGGANAEDIKQKDYTLRQLLDDFDADFGASEGIEPQVEASVRQIMGNAYCKLGLTEKAQAHLERAFELRPELRASTAELDLSLLHDWVLLLHDQARYPEAIEECDATLARLEAARAPNAAVIDVLQQRGDLRRHVAEFDGAEADLRRSLELGAAEPALGAETTMLAQYKLAQVLDDKRSLREAGELARAALAACERLIGPESSRAAAAHNLIGQIADHRQDFEAAQRSFERAVAIESALHGDADYRLGPLVDNLGRVHVERGHFAAAEPYLRQAVAISRASLGASHPGLATALSNLGTALDSRGDSAGAEAAYRECLAIRTAAFGEQHADVARALLKLGALLRSRAGSTEGIECLRRALAIRRYLFGDNDASVANALAALSTALTVAGELDEAEAAAQQALTIQRGAARPNPLFIAAAAISLSAIELRRGDTSAAVVLRREALAMRAAMLGERHPDVLRTRAMLGEALLRDGALEEAENELRAAENLQPSLLGESHDDVARTRQSLGALAERKGSLDEAQALYGHALESRRKSAGDAAQETLDSARCLVRVLEACGNTQEADALRDSLGLTLADISAQ